MAPWVSLYEMFGLQDIPTVGVNQVLLEKNPSCSVCWEDFKLEEQVQNSLNMGKVPIMNKETISTFFKISPGVYILPKTYGSTVYFSPLPSLRPFWEVI